MAVTNNDANNVTAGKPKVGGAVFRAPLGTALPTDTTKPLDEKFENLGYISEDGISFTTEKESESIKAWGGEVVNTVQTGYSETCSLTFIEALRDTVLKTVRGDANVSGTLSAGLKVSTDASEDVGHIYVVEQVLKGNVAMRTVIPCAKVTEIGDITFSDGELIGYETTLTLEPDNTGKYHYEYYKGGAAAA